MAILDVDCTSKVTTLWVKKLHFSFESPWFVFKVIVSIVVYLYSNKWLHLYLNTYHASLSVYYCKFQKYFLKSSTGMLQGWSQVCWSSRIFWMRKFDFQVFHQIDILAYSHFDEHHNSWQFLGRLFLLTWWVRVHCAWCST